jgi:hypothetical protein
MIEHNVASFIGFTSRFIGNLNMRRLSRGGLLNEHVYSEDSFVFLSISEMELGQFLLCTFHEDKSSVLVQSMRLACVKPFLP